MPILWEKPDKTICIMTLSERFLAAQRLPSETTTDAVLRLAEIERLKNSDLQNAVLYLVTSASMPTDYSKRNAWRIQNGHCVIDRAVILPIEPDSLEQRITKLENWKLTHE